MRLIIVATTVLSLIGLSQAASNPTCQETHIAVKGETCQTIAAQYGHTRSEIQQWTKKSNSGFDCNNLKVGESICVKYASSVDKRGEKPEPKPQKPLSKTTTTKKHHAPKDLGKRGNHEPKKHNTTKKPAAKKN